ncbi:hypothetical protein AVEN_44264-1 [Araneus ventricosus]|uniref:Uncharacterized protein n=1 Tax=Araneus ventricosus TaxID=182803 RepID=A0A4Y2UBU7_ARAVE|nr:hypothetical protein AVEN_44264-1 [Araneus ventricosus]
MQMSLQAKDYATRFCAVRFRRMLAVGQVVIYCGRLLSGKGFFRQRLPFFPPCPALDLFKWPRTLQMDRFSAGHHRPAAPAGWRAAACGCHRNTSLTFSNRSSER